MVLMKFIIHLSHCNIWEEIRFNMWRNNNHIVMQRWSTFSSCWSHCADVCRAAPLVMVNSLKPFASFGAQVWAFYVVKWCNLWFIKWFKCQKQLFATARVSGSTFSSLIIKSHPRPFLKRSNLIHKEKIYQAHSLSCLVKKFLELLNDVSCKRNGQRFLFKPIFWSRDPI